VRYFFFLPFSLGLTGHTEVVRVVFSPKDISLEKLLKVFWESHDPTQGKQTHLFPHIYKHSLTQMSIERPLGVRCSGPKANGLMRLKHGCICLFTLPCACVCECWMVRMILRELEQPQTGYVNVSETNSAMRGKETLCMCALVQASPIPPIHWKQTQS